VSNVKDGNDPQTKGTEYVCQKHEIAMPAEHLACRDPRVYCKFRTSCAIHFLTRRRAGLDGPGTAHAAAPGLQDHESAPKGKRDEGD
jgi:hypothetical protein